MSVEASPRIIEKLPHPAVAHILQYFKWEHLPPYLQEVSRPFAELAHKIALKDHSPETTVALRKLLESKDAAVRAALELTPRPSEITPTGPSDPSKDVAEAARKGFKS